jgi:hypothetical protein
VETKAAKVFLNFTERLPGRDGGLEVRRKPRSEKNQVSGGQCKVCAHPRGFPRMIRSGGASPDIKSSNEGPEVKVSRKLDFVPIGVAVAKERDRVSETRFAARNAEAVARDIVQ